VGVPNHPPTHIPSTFDEATAKKMIGERVPGSVIKKPCDPYEFLSKTTFLQGNLSFFFAQLHQFI
jgi:hypothetical protein